MNSEQIDRRVRDADPYQPGIAGRLDGAEHTLLEEIMSVPDHDHRRSRRVTAGRTAGLIAAAAAVTGIFVVPALLRDKPAVDAAPQPPAQTDTLPYPAAALQAAEKNPRLLIDEPGWKVTTVYGFADENGTIAFTKGKNQVEMNWYPAKQYQGYYKDRLEVSPPQKTTVDGDAADIFTYSASDFAVMLKPRGDAFVEIRVGGAWTRATFDQLVTRIKHVDVQTWLAALPPSVVTPANADARAAAILKGVPLPPGLDPKNLGIKGANDPYQFGAEVTSKVGCGWITEWKRATAAKDTQGRQRAEAALRGSHHWKVLTDMSDEGGWSQVFWEIADKVAAGTVPDGYKEGIGCGS